MEYLKKLYISRNKGHEIDGPQTQKTMSSRVIRPSSRTSRAHPISPFLIPEIMVKIFNNLDPEELPKCRRVCKLWSVVALERIRAHSTITLDSDRQRYLFLNFGQNLHQFKNLKLQFYEETTVQSMFELFELCSIHGKSLESFAIDFYFRNDPQESPITMKEFHDICLTSLNELLTLKLIRIPCVLLHGALYPRHQTPTTTPLVLEKLTTLDMNFSSDDHCPNLSTVNHNNMDVFIQFIGLAPNLKILKVSNTIRRYPESGSSRLVQALLDVKPQGFKELHYYGNQMPKELAINLSNSDLHIERLVIHEFQGFLIDFESNLNGNVITLKERRGCFQAIPAKVIREIIKGNIETSDAGISATVLLRKFMEAHRYQEWEEDHRVIWRGSDM